MSRGYARGIGLDPGVYRVDEPRLVDGIRYEASVRLLDAGEPPCPRCGGPSVAHDSKVVDVYHEPHRNRPLILKLRKERRRCKRCDKTFYVEQPLLSGITPHVSALCAEFIGRRISEGAATARIEHECGAQKSIIAKVEAGLELPKHKAPAHVCIDEVRAFKKKSAVPRGLPHMCTCVYDAERKTLVDMAAGDRPETVKPFLRSFSAAGRDAVQSVSCDLNGSYINMARELFPNAGIYADKFHVSKLVTGAVEEPRNDLRRVLVAERSAAEQELERAKAARKKARSQARRHPGAAGLPEAEDAAGAADDALKESKARVRTLDAASKLMLSRHAELAASKRAKVRAALALGGADALRRAYLALQMFYAWSDAEYGTRVEMGDALRDWARKARLAKVRPMTRAAETITKDKHFELILNGWEHGRTNAVAEAMNRRIKDIIREARGFNSFDALRRRCLLVLGHERVPNKPIPLFKRRSKKAEGGDAG